MMYAPFGASDVFAASGKSDVLRQDRKVKLSVPLSCEAQYVYGERRNIVAP